VGKTLGRYRLVQHLGSGGVAHVFLAETQGDARERVALKLLREELFDRAEIVQRFHREAEAAQRIRHPYVIRVGDLEELPGGGRFFTCELLVGLDLADSLTFAGGSLDPERAVRIASGIAEGLEAAHRAGVVHRDLKPENVFLVHAADGRELVKVLDFGSAWLSGDVVVERRSRITSSLRPVGTPEYTAPEQTEGREGAPAADIYALGVVLFEILTGSVPFEGKSFAELAHRHAQAPIPGLASRGARASSALDAVVYRCLAKSPEERYPSMEALRAALAEVPEALGD
jgi:eukaryotic-like serine/threonine-protein kinase